MHKQLLNIADIRREYLLTELDESTVNDNPLEFFKIWFTNAQNAKANDVNAMTLATVDGDLQPHARIVLLKELDAKGFVFFTNYLSNKGNEMEYKNKAALLFYWHELERQIRIEGIIEKVSDEISTTYFQSRPDGSKLGAWASPQSRKIESRKVIDDNLDIYKKQFSDTEIPRPPHWGGYRLIPNRIEFWQGRPSRLHDRILFTLTEDNIWQKCRLAP